MSGCQAWQRSQRFRGNLGEQKVLTSLTTPVKLTPKVINFRPPTCAQYFIDEKMKKKESPLIYVVAGSPASGKTSFVHKGLEGNIFPKDAVAHDCDAVMCALPGYQSDLKKYGSAEAYSNWELIARERAEAQLSHAIVAKKDILYDRSCALLSSYVFLENIVKKQGYKLIMHAMHIDINQALARAKSRESKTGRHMPPMLLQERLEMFSALWPYYVALSEKAYLYDNNGRSTYLIASCSCNKLEIQDNIIYQNFIAQGQSQVQTVKSLLTDATQTETL